MLAEHEATHDDMAFVFNNLALAEVGLGNDAAAEPFFVQAWAAADLHRHRMRAPILTDWADLDCRGRRFESARARLAQGRPLLAEDYPDDAWRKAWLELVSASCDLASGNLPAATSALTANLPAVSARWPDDTSYGYSALERGAAIQRAAGNRAEADALERRMRLAAAPHTASN
jgi:hypothetical protein